MISLLCRITLSEDRPLIATVLVVLSAITIIVNYALFDMVWSSGATELSSLLFTVTISLVLYCGYLVCGALLESRLLFSVRSNWGAFHTSVLDIFPPSPFEHLWVDYSSTDAVQSDTHFVTQYGATVNEMDASQTQADRQRHLLLAKRRSAKELWIALIASSILWALAVSCTLAAMSVLNNGDSPTGVATLGVFVIIGFGAVFMKERVTLSVIIAFILLVAGTVFVIQPRGLFGQNSIPFKGVILLLIGCWFFASTVVIVRRFRATLHWLALSISIALATFIALFIVVVICDEYSSLNYWQWSLRAWYGATIIGTLQCLAFTAYVLALQLDRMGNVSILSALSAPFSYLAIAAVHKEAQQWFSYVGIVCCCISFVVVAFAAYRRSKAMATDRSNNATMAESEVIGSLATDYHTLP